MKALLLTAMIVGTAARAGAGPIVAIDGGRIEGERMADERLAFRAVPFAAPPVGALRWRPPAPVKAWQGLRQAAKSAPSCPQLSDGWNKANAAYSAEDCLYLEVATPTLKPDRPMPVFVWIHGGSNKAGGAGGTISSSMVEHGIVLVSIQYRLGALGFMAHPALSAEEPWRGSGNWGLLDQQAALRWVRRNIAAFGGDPGNVTIGGESAGAQDVGLQTLSPLARGLYRRAIEESGTASFGFAPRDLKTSEHYGVLIAAAAGAKAQTAAALRALPAAAILKAERAVRYPGLYENGTVWLQTTIDGHVVPADPKRLYASGRINPGALIIGTNAREIGFFGDDRGKAVAAIRSAFGANAGKALAAYGLGGSTRPPGDQRQGSVEMQAATDIVFRCPARFVASNRVRAGQPVWQYQFDYQGMSTKPVSHAGELRYVFSAPAEDGLSPDAPPMQAYWLNFIRTGNPNGATLPNWPGYDLKERPYLSFGHNGTEAADDLAGVTCGLIAGP